MASFGFWTCNVGFGLLAYLVGLLPKSYTLSSVEALRRRGP